MHVTWESEGEQPKTRAAVVTALGRIKAITGRSAAILTKDRPPGLVIIDIFDGVSADVEKCRSQGVLLVQWEGDAVSKARTSASGGHHAST